MLTISLERNTTFTRALATAFVLALGGFGLACGSSSSGGATSAGDAGTPDGAADGGTGTLTMFVVEPVDPTVLPSTAKALPGAQVAVDFTGGAHLEGKADANGRIDLPGADLTKPYSVVTYATGHVMSAMTGVTAERIKALPSAAKYWPPAGTDYLVVTLGPLPTTQPKVTLTGAIKNQLDAAHSVQLTTWGTLNASLQAGGGTYTVTAPSGKAFSLIGAEWAPGAAPPPRGLDMQFFKWFRVDSPALTANTTLDVDVTASAALTPTKFTGTVQVPGGSTGPFSAATFGGQVGVLEPGNLVAGGPAHAEASVDGASFTFNGEYVNVDGSVPAHVSCSWFLQNADGSFTAKFTKGYPDATVAVTDMMQPLAVTVAKHKLSDPIDVGTRPAGTLLEYQILNASYQLLFAWDELDPAATTLTLPPLPAAAAALLPSLGKGRVLAYAGVPDAELGMLWNTYSGTRTFSVSK